MPRHTSVTVGYFSNQEEPAPTSLDVATYNQAKTKRVVFGHQSVGGQVIKGVDSGWATRLGVARPTVVDVTSDSIPSSGGFFGHFYVGTNGDPYSKTSHLADLLRNTSLSSQIDVCFMKYCYADLRSDTAEAMFADYEATMDALVAEFPAIDFIYATQTIVMVNDEDGPNNTYRMKFNNLVRAKYQSTGRLWDIAKALSTDPDGVRNTTVVGGLTVEHLCGVYASPDLEHISGTGGIGPMAAAEPLLIILGGL